MVFHNLLLVMSLSGSIVFILYVLLYPVTRRYFSQKWRYRVLKIAAVFYLVPFSEYKYRVVGLTRTVFPHFLEKVWHISETIDTEYMIITRPEHIEISPKVSCLRILMLLSVIFTIYIILKHIIIYCKVKRICYSDNEDGLNQEYKELFFKIKDELRVRQNVKMIHSEYFDSPLTSGILSPVIVLPMWAEDKIDRDAYEYIIRHELIHIKHHDGLVKFIGVLVMAVHWFNPVSYLFFRELSSMCEMCCDSIVVAGKGKRERSQYEYLLLEMSSANNIFSERGFGTGLASSRRKIIFKRRILEMRREQKHKKFLAVIMSGIFCMAGAITAFAYIPPVTMTVDDGIPIRGEIQFSAGDETIESLLYNDFFTDAKGIIYEIAADDIEEKAGCNHNYVSGTASKHERNSDGSCTLFTYFAERCVNCGHIILGGLKNIETNLVCPH